jgi:hypothetical protein
MWNQLVRDGRVKSVKVYLNALNANDIVPGRNMVLFLDPIRRRSGFERLQP